MPITFTAIGARATGPSGNITPGLPAGFAADDIFILVIEASDQIVITLPSGWTKIIELQNGTTERFTVGWRRAAAGDGNPTVTHTNGADIIGKIAGFRGAITSGDPFDASSSQANASSATVTAPAITPVNANDMIIFCGCTTAGGPATFSGYSGTNPTFTEAIDDGFVGSGPTDPAIFLAYGIKTDTTTTGSRTATATAADVNIGALLSMQEAAGAATVREQTLAMRQGFGRR